MVPESKTMIINSLYLFIVDRGSHVPGIHFTPYTRPLLLSLESPEDSELFPKP